MGDGIWIGPVVSGAVFGLFFALLYPRMARWLSKGQDVPQQRPMVHVLTGLGAGIGFGALLLLDKLVDAGAVGPAWNWFQLGAKWFGALCIVGGVFVVGARQLRGRTRSPVVKKAQICLDQVACSSARLPFIAAVRRVGCQSDRRALSAEET
jgi:hypothetical protein